MNSATHRKKTWTRATGQRPGMTLIEILAVMVVIAILMSLVLGIASVAGKKQDTAKAHSDLNYIRLQLGDYLQKEGRIPTGNGTALNDAVFKRDYLDAGEQGLTYSGNSPLDPWGHTYVYQTLDGKGLGKNAYKLGSRGPDGRYGQAGSDINEFGEGDDIQ